MAEWKRSKWKGYTALVIACALGILLALNWLNMLSRATQGAFPGVWDGVLQAWRVVFVLYFAYVAQRHLRAQPMVLAVSGRNVGWGRIILGGLMIFSGVQKRWHPVHSPYELKPSNATEAASMEATGLYLIPGAGILVLLWGISPLWQKSEEVAGVS